ncbi:MAG: right-handed parallel beta-helix repeat-containing protein, partial [Promicromonosporaceae bacterium]|nr:right-handed parallel beta-helix repeat-containing protein [Promicromonosporaceae bacterium]
ADVEINVRKSVFTPTDPHIDYVTVRGFRLGRAATPWAPPTAEQVGLIGPGWAKGWVIEDNLIFDSKCAGISLGKERGTGQNKSTVYGDKPGYQYQIEAVHDALDRGWSREQIGSHLVRRNVIRDCGQNGIVGHLGCVFSTIADNHIYRIGTKHEFFGAEIAGIKLHAPIDVQIVHNRIHDTTLGIWLDWQVQGARVTRNVLYRNTRDLFVEVCHGPTLIDHNLLASPIALELLSQGNALVGNLIAGSVRVQNVLDRATPYHRAHSTTVAGHAFTYAGDDRWYGNLFVGAPGGAYHPDLPLPMKQDDFPLETYGTEAYEGFPGSWEDYLARVAAAASPIDHVRFHFQRQAAYLGHNVYAGGARPASHEATAVVVAGPATARVSDDDDTVWLDLDLPSAVLEAVTPVTTGADLGHVRIAGLEFENPDGTPVRADIDLLGNWKTAPAAAGPLQYLATGPTKIWW